MTNSEANDILGRELGAVAYIVFCWILCKIGGYQWRRYCRADTKIVSTRLNVNEPSILKQPLWGKYD